MKPKGLPLTIKTFPSACLCCIDVGYLPQTITLQPHLQKCDCFKQGARYRNWQNKQNKNYKINIDITFGR
jgi:hypothetical protein